MSVLFCDLVGFTAASERPIPRTCGRGSARTTLRLREEIERYGGTVEKFVGDAVMAVFGAPVAHEDDAERAVRAGLRILEAIGELNEADPGLSLQVRVGINTGEAVVALGARPEQGEGIVDRRRGQHGLAAAGGGAGGRGGGLGADLPATERVFEYEPLEPVAVKGKAEPLAIWRPLRARARFGTDVTRDAHDAAGRPRAGEAAADRHVRARGAAALLPAGDGRGRAGGGQEPACARSCSRYIEERPGLVRWRQGRCLPYGEGIAFWALGEIVKAECGILESDSPEEAAAKLERGAPRRRSGPGLAAGAARAAGRRRGGAGVAGGVVHGLAALPASRWPRSGPTVLVFEDLHWADPALLAFLEHLADWAEGVPLLLLCTARPELYEQHPTWAAGLRNATTINLAPLTRRGDRAADRGAARAGGAAGGDAAGAARAGGRQPAVCGGVRAPARRTAASSSEAAGGAGLGAGADRRPPRHALARSGRACSRTPP